MRIIKVPVQIHSDTDATKIEDNIKKGFSFVLVGARLAQYAKGAEFTIFSSTQEIIDAELLDKEDGTPKT